MKRKVDKIPAGEIQTATGFLYVPRDLNTNPQRGRRVIIKASRLSVEKVNILKSLRRSKKKTEAAQAARERNWVQFPTLKEFP